ncbi:MAG TPA: IclR family transcriptional regulator [Paenibacillaceae bacterium]
MMERKYWVPALEKAHKVLDAIAQEPARLKLTDLCSRLGISKSTMFSLLGTMETLGWLRRLPNDTYVLGKYYGYLGNAFFRQYDLVAAFGQEARPVMQRLGESIQLATLDGNEVLYLAKETAPTPVQMVAGPGVRVPAHATGLGKTLLAWLPEEELLKLYPEEKLKTLTEYTISTRGDLMRHLAAVREQGYAIDNQECVMGFHCVAAPVRQADGQVMAAVSASIPAHLWEQKKDQARAEILALAERLSLNRP